MPQLTGPAISADDPFSNLEQVPLPVDRFFDPWWTAASDAMRAVVSDVISQVQAYETHEELRKRTRKQSDRTIFAAAVEAVVCDMTRAFLDGDSRGTAVPLSNTILGKRSRYRPAAYSRTLPQLLSVMASPELDFIRMEKGNQGDHRRRGQRTLIWPGQRLITRINAKDIDLDDLRASPFTETIILKKSKEDYWDKGEYAEYDDDAVTSRYREELAQINGSLQDAELEVETGALSTPFPRPSHPRELRRVFTRSSFQSGGRLFGGFWQNMSGRDRLAALRIDHERVVELDYEQMAPRILYGMVGATPDQEDLYTIPGIAPVYRKGIKTLFNAMLFSAKPLMKKPKGTSSQLPNVPVQQICKNIIQAHPAIVELFHTDVGHRVQFIESEIMVSVLLKLIDMNIVALPIHDGLLVSRSGKEAAKSVMEENAELISGVRIPVSISAGLTTL